MDKIIIKDKRIVDFYNKNKNLNIEDNIIMIIDLYENMLDGISVEFNKHVSSDILKNIKENGLELDQFKNELNTLIKSNIEIYKSEMNNMKTINNLSNVTLNHEVLSIKTTLDKLNIEITNNVISKFYDTRNDYKNELKLLIDKNGNDNLIKILDKIGNGHDTLMEKTTSIISDIIPKSNSDYYNNHNIIIKEFKEDIIRNIETIKTDIKDNKSDISIDKLNILIGDKYNNLLSLVQNNVQNYVSISEDRVKYNIDELKTLSIINQDIQTKLNTDLNLFLNQYKNNSSKKGEYGEYLLETILVSLFPSCEILNTTGQTGSGDFILNRPDNKVKILFENKNYDNCNVPKRDVEKFIRDCENQNCSGVMMSQFSGIALKKNFEIDINNQNVLIYVQNMQNDPDKIIIACTLIDTITSILKKINCDTGNAINITNNQLKIINDQYHNFIAKRESVINLLNENNKNVISTIKELEFSELNVVLSSVFASTNIINLKCNICNNYIATSNKALTNHKRVCKIKHAIKDESDDLESPVSIEETVIIHEPITDNSTKKLIIKKSNNKKK
jgi:hypothetical protein